MRINKGTFVRVQYELKDSETKEVLEATTQENALEYIHGMGLMLPAFEAELTGLEVGDTFDFVIPALNAYGEASEEYLIGVPREAFLVDGKFDEEMVFEGAVLPMTTADGQQVHGVVQSIESEKVMMDFNHPLAGVDLHFVGKVEDVHEPSEEEYNAILHPHSGGCCGCSGHDHEGCCSGCH